MAERVDCQPDAWAQWAIEKIQRLSEARLSADTAWRIAAYLETLPPDRERDAILKILEPYRPEHRIATKIATLCRDSPKYVSGHR